MNRELLIGLVIGLILGWLIEWIIDRYFLRRRLEVVERALEEKKDDLKMIKGIGSEIEQRLNKAGIYTFKQVSKMDHFKIERLIGSPETFADEKVFIKQAKKLAKREKKK